MSRDAFSFYLVDASGFIFRAFHALPPLVNARNEPVGAVYGFVSMLLTLLQGHHPTKLGIVFDVSRATFRQTLYPDYKINRLAPPPELVSQFALVREACQAFGLPILERPGFEADDLIASYVADAATSNTPVTLVSSDKDLMQLISPLTRMWDPMKRKEVREPEVLEKFGVSPAQVIDVQALMGDPSDNIPGVPGIGLKTAQVLIREFGSLDNLYTHMDQLPPTKRREALIAHEKEAFLSRQLVTLVRDVPLPLPSEALHFQGITTAPARDFLKSHGFTSLINRLPTEAFALSMPEPASTAAAPTVAPTAASPLETTAPLPVTYTLIQDHETLTHWMSRATQQGFVAVDLETTSLDPLKAEIVGIALGLTPGEAGYIPVAHTTTAPQIALQDALGLLRPLFENPGVLKIGHHLKYDGLVLKKYGLSLFPLDDTLLLSYVLHGGQHLHNLDFLSQHYLHHTTLTYKQVVGEGKNEKPFKAVPLERACAYAAEDADMTLRLWHLFKPRLKENHLTRLYERVERPLVEVLIDLEATGIRVDAQALQTLSAAFEERLTTLTQEIHHLAGKPFNIGSPQQLGTVLFEDLALPSGKKTKTGAYATASDVLEKLAAQGHPIAQKILDWRGTAKLKNTYTDALPHQIHPTTGRIHTSFLMAGTATGRLASTDPNLQNIPIRTEEGRAIRQAFIPAEGCVLGWLEG